MMGTISGEKESIDVAVKESRICLERLLIWERPPKFTIGGLTKGKEGDETGSAESEVTRENDYSRRRQQ